MVAIRSCATFVVLEGETERSDGGAVGRFGKGSTN